MTTIVNQRANDRGGAAQPPPVPAPVGRLPRRRRWGLFALGVVLVVVCAVVAYLLVVTAGVTRPYLAVTRRVPYGATLRDSDLTVVDVNPAAGLAPIPAGQRDHVVGKHAGADLFPGTLLQGRTVIGSGAEIGPDTRLVDCVVGEQAVVEFTVGRDAEIGPGAIVGPFAE